MQIKGRIVERLYNKDGNLKDTYEIENMITDYGNNFLRNLIGYQTPGLNKIPTGISYDRTVNDTIAIMKSTNDAIEKVFSGTMVDSFRETLSLPAWWGVDFGTELNSKIISTYRLFANDDDPLTMAPKDWELQGSNDNLIWETLDHREDVTWLSIGWKSFDCKKVGLYQYYRLFITANNGNATLIGIAQIEFFENKEYIGRIGFGLDNIETIPSDYTLTQLKSPIIKEQSYKVINEMPYNTGYIYGNTIHFTQGIKVWTNASNAGNQLGAIFVDNVNHQISLNPIASKINFDFGGIRKLYKYEVYSNSGTSNPKDWTFEASFDGTFTDNGGGAFVLDTQTNQDPDTLIEYTITSNKDYYRFYRWNVTDNNGGSTYTSITNFNVYEETLNWGVGEVNSIPFLQPGDIVHEKEENRLRISYRWTNDTGSALDIGETGLFATHEDGVNTDPLLGYPLGSNTLLSRLIRSPKTHLEPLDFIIGDYYITFVDQT